MIKTVAQRTGVLLAVAAVAYLPANPLVRLEAVLGLSPAPLERYLGIKNVFSGMTEGMHQLIHGELGRALDANILTPLVVCALLFWAVTGVRVTTRQQEFWGGMLFVGLSALVNIAHPLP
jgi:hypothetical protein